MAPNGGCDHDREWFENNKVIYPPAVTAIHRAMGLRNEEEAEEFKPAVGAVVADAQKAYLAALSNFDRVRGSLVEMEMLLTTAKDKLDKAKVTYQEALSKEIASL